MQTMGKTNHPRRRKPAAVATNSGATIHIVNDIRHTQHQTGSSRSSRKRKISRDSATQDELHDDEAINSSLQKVITPSSVVVRQHPKHGAPPLSQQHCHAAAAASVTASSSSSSMQQQLPLPFPTHLPRPTKGFLRDEAPYHESFAAAIDTSYQGFVVDYNVLPSSGGGSSGGRNCCTDAKNADKSPPGDDQTMLPLLPSVECMEQTLCETLRSHFRYDVTQPFGLGTACAKTYVTRCLVGDAGTTYKYLGLRMFAHSWPEPIQQLKDHISNRVENVHLPALYGKRRRRNKDQQQSHQLRTTTVGSSKLDVCLINCMTTNHPHLKAEKLDPHHYRTTVSWHADSSLEHYSTIAVYQMVLQQQQLPSSSSFSQSSSQIGPAHKRDPGENGKTKGAQSSTAATATTDDTATADWAVGLRVVHHSEGPNCATLRKGAMDDAVVQETPPIAVSLPNNSVYYLLDDFNHHHQHTVLTSAPAPKSSGRGTTPKDNKNNRNDRQESIRYSLTFRLLRDSHNVHDMIERCDRCALQFHKRKTIKLIRSQQLLLTELESEWIQQLYIQGSRHRRLLFASSLSTTESFHWEDAICKLWSHWSKLEERTYHTVLWLQHAAEGKCHVQTASASKASMQLSKAERKLRDKRRKALTTLEEMMGQQQEKSSSGPSVYETLAQLLTERAEMRERWTQRASDPVFHDLSQEDRPLTLPSQFNVAPSNIVHDGAAAAAQNKEVGTSPMPGAPHELRLLADNLRAWENAFQSGREQDLPSSSGLVEHVPSQVDNIKGSNAVHNVNVDSAPHTKSADWLGWSEWDHFGLEMQCPWARAILDGQKTIETRAYPLPLALMGKKIVILESPQGNSGVSSVANQVTFTGPNDAVKAVGWCIFGSVTEYTNRKDFENDEKLHLLTKSSGYGWNDESTTAIYGWKVHSTGPMSNDDVEYATATRRMRSLYQLYPRAMGSKSSRNKEHNKWKGKRKLDGKKDFKKKRRF